MRGKGEGGGGGGCEQQLLDTWAVVYTLKLHLGIIGTGAIH